MNEEKKEKPAQWIPSGGLKGIYVSNKLGECLNLRLRLGFWQADWTLAVFPQASLLEEFDALEPLENGTLSTGAAGDFE